MIPLNSHGSDGPPRSLSPAVTAELAAAMRSFAAGSRTSEAWLQRALSAAALEAREMGLRPEELVLALKRIEVTVSRASTRSLPEQEAFHTRILAAMLEAYFRDP